MGIQGLQPSESNLSLGLEKVLRDYDLSHSRLVLINRSENDTYRVETPDNEPLAILRVSPPGCRTEAEIHSELDWMDALRADAGLSTPRALPTQAGRRVSWLETREHAAVPCVLFQFFWGREPLPAGLPQTFVRLGAIAARIHDHSKRWVKPAAFTRQRFNCNSLIGSNAIWGDWRLAPHLTAADRRLLSEVSSQAQQAVADSATSAEADYLIHGDLRPGNTLQDGDHLHVIDFDDCGYCWPLFELATSLTLLEHTTSAPELLGSWLTGYETVRQPSALERSSVPHLIMIRRLQILSWFASHPQTQIAQNYAPVVVPSTVEASTVYLRNPRSALGAPS